MQRLSLRFRSQQFFLCKIRGEAFSSNLQTFVWRRHVGAHPHGHQHGGRKPTEIPANQVCYKSVNLSLEELKNSKIILFFNTRNCSYSQIPRNKPRNKSLLILTNCHAKTKKFKRSLLRNKNPFGTKICTDNSFQLLLYIIKV